MLTRRTFLQTSASIAAITALEGPRAFAAVTAPSGMRFGYAAITWGKAEKQAIDDVSSVGYPGIQFRIEATTEFKPEELRDTLAKHNLTFVALSSGQVSLDADEETQLAEHVANAKFLKAAGGQYLQILDHLTSYDRVVTPADCEKLGKLLTKLGRRTADVGVPLGYHNHLNTISQRPENLDLIMQASDPKYVKLELDTAHIKAGGGDPAAAIEKYHDRLLFMHLKDVIEKPMTSPMKYPFKFVELGQGTVDFAAVFAALNKHKFNGWAVVELDAVTSPDRSAKESAAISKKFLIDKFNAHSFATSVHLS